MSECTIESYLNLSNEELTNYLTSNRSELIEEILKGRKNLDYDRNSVSKIEKEFFNLILREDKIILEILKEAYFLISPPIEFLNLIKEFDKNIYFRYFNF